MNNFIKNIDYKKYAKNNNFYDKTQNFYLTGNL